MLSTLPKSVIRQLTSAHGWLQLGDWEEAGVELEGIIPEYKSHPLVLGMKVEILKKASAWPMVAEISRYLTGIEPAQVAHWINYAYGARRAEGLEQAREILERAKALFPAEAMIWFNLACYLAQLGLLAEAKIQLDESIRLDSDFRRMALEDPDLDPIRDLISSSI